MKLDPIITVTLNPAIDRLMEVERFLFGGHQLGRERARVPAGKGVNVSKALARLGLPSIATGFLGRNNAQAFEAMLMAESEQPYCRRINLQFFQVPGTTRENVTVLDASSGVETHIRDQGAEIPERELVRLKRKLDLMSRPGSLVVFGGGLPPGVSGEQFAQLVHICSSAGARVAVDSSAEALAAVREERLFLVKPNRLELTELLGQNVGTDRAALIEAGKELASRFEYVLISLGAEGGLAFNRGQAVAGHVEIDPSRVVSTVGCGDCLLAGFLAGLNQGKQLLDAYAMALATATANVLSGTPAEFNPAQVDAFLKSTRVELMSSDNG